MKTYVKQGISGSKSVTKMKVLLLRELYQPVSFICRKNGTRILFSELPRFRTPQGRRKRQTARCISLKDDPVCRYKESPCSRPACNLRAYNLRFPSGNHKAYVLPGILRNSARPNTLPCSLFLHHNPAFFNSSSILLRRLCCVRHSSAIRRMVSALSGYFSISFK